MSIRREFLPRDTSSSKSSASKRDQPFRLSWCLSNPGNVCISSTGEDLNSVFRATIPYRGFLLKGTSSFIINNGLFKPTCTYISSLCSTINSLGVFT